MVRTKHAISYFYVKPKIILCCQLLMDQWQRHLNFIEPTKDNPWPSCSKSFPPGRWGKLAKKKEMIHFRYKLY